MQFPALGRVRELAWKSVSLPATRLGLSTLLIFALALGSSWTWAITQGDPCDNPAAGLCVTAGAVPCSAIPCSPTGTGYQCDPGGGVMTTEAHYKLTIPGSLTRWPKCWTGLSTQSCGHTWQPCGSTYNYAQPDTHCTITCKGTWLWLNCQAGGSPCTN
jgi:hypothetical protein